MTAGAIFELAMGAGVAQGDDYTEPVTGFSLGSEDRACRWQPRTRFSGFSAHHFYQISEEGPRNDNLQSVPLRLEIFDFGAQGDGPSLEVHGGRDRSTMTLERLTFDAGAMHYELRITNGPAVMEAAHNGARAWSETMLAYKTGPQDNSGD